MRLTTAFILGVTSLVAARIDPVTPSMPNAPVNTSLTSGSAAEFAYHACGLVYGEYDYFLECGLNVAYADGSIRTVASFEDSPYATGHRATWSPDATKIAFANGWGGEVMVITIADLSLVNLTNHPASDHSPAWSPDGARIVFQSNRDGAPELYFMNADGSNVVRLTHGVGVFSDGAHATWSPDGLRIAFTCGGSGEPEICVINTDGTGFAHLTSDPNSHNYDPDWSPDGARIAFTTSALYLPPGSGQTSIALMNADGTGVTQVGLGREPDWSPDGGRIVFTLDYSRACDTYGICEPGIFIMNADGSAAQFLLNGHGAAWAPVSLPPPPPPPNQPPVAGFTYGCSLLACTFDSSSSSDDRGIVSWTWSFGDGQTSTAPSPSHTFAAPGMYLVTLTVVDASGLADSVAKNIAPDPPPYAAFGFSCAEVTCTFTSSSSDDNGIVTWRWDFGDGQSSASENPTHRYASGGAYTVTLTVTDVSGSSGSYTLNIYVIPPNWLFSATGSVVRGVAQVYLSWSSPAGGDVDVFRDNIKLVTTANDGVYLDTLGRGKRGNFTYKVCIAGTSICSSDVPVTF